MDEWRIKENEFVSSKLSDCIVYPIANTVDDDPLYSRSDLEMDMMLLCDHNSSPDSFSIKRASSSLLDDFEVLMLVLTKKPKHIFGPWLNLEDLT